MNEKRRNYLRLKKAEQRKKTKRVELTLSQEQYDILKHHSERHDEKFLSVYIRDAALAYSEQVYILPNLQSDEMHQLRRYLVSCANNVNQLVRYTHSEGNLSGQVLQDIQAHIASLDHAVAEAFEIPPSLWDLFIENLPYFPEPFLQNLSRVLSGQLSSTPDNATD